MTNKRRISEFLPEVLQTDILRKFLAATGDHLFQPGNVEYVNGYVGNIPGYARESDVYVPESSVERKAYQFSVTATSNDPESGDITHTMFYDDLINKLRFQGALVDDHNRLFQAEYYSFGLPIDMDKWLNFINYVWLPEGPNLIILTSETNVRMIVTQSSFTYEGTYVIQGGEAQQGSLTLSTGMRVRFTQDVNPQVRAIDYIVEGVGNRIRLVPDNVLSSLAWDSPPLWDNNVWDGSSLSTVPTYVTMGRGSANANPWSAGNRWFHRDVAISSGTPEDQLQGARAQRPILEFDPHIKLWNMGTQSRGLCNLVDVCATSLNQVQGKPSYVVYENCDLTGTGVALDDGMIVLFTNLRDPLNPNELDANLNNRLYQVTNLRSSGGIVLQVLPRGSDLTGAPQQGDSVFVLQGDVSKPDIRLSHINSTWWFNQGRWIKGQSRQTTNNLNPSAQELAIYNQFPLFDVFDYRGNSLADPAVYPNSSFQGSTLVQYKIRSSGAPDPYLGFVPDYQDVSPTDFVFQVTLDTDVHTYLQNSLNRTIPGYKFYKTQDVLTLSDSYQNCWYKCASLSRQYVVNEHWGTGTQTVFDMDQIPDLTAPMPPAIRVEVGGVLRSLGQCYNIKNGKIELVVPPANGELVKIKTWAGLHNKVSEGYFEQPANLIKNPNNLNVEEFSRSDLVAHVKTMIENQINFSGACVGSNNWRDTARDQSLGTEILQHRAPLLKLMGLNSPNANEVFETSNSVVDPYVAIQWAQNEYLRFYNKMVNTLVNLFNNQAYTSAQTPDQWIAAAIKQINVGKTSRNAWAYSGFEQENGAYCSSISLTPTWVPPSATRLGVTPAWLPMVFLDDSQPDQPLSLRCHNGAVVVLKDLAGNSLGTIQGGTSTSDVARLTHPVAQAWLLFEQRMFDSMPLHYRDAEAQLHVDARIIFSGKYRKTSYTRQDMLTLLSPAFQKWSTFNQLDSLRNTTFDLADPWSWNYGNCLDLDGEPVPGHWRGIYMYFYDTDEPHKSPWHMLGFSQKPQWWDQEYGSAPYTRGNLKLWRHLESGTIAQGPRAGVHAEWARPGLLRCIPVNDVGQLMSPNITGMLSNLPSAVEAAADWKFGDRSPIENVWLTTVESDFVWATVTYQSAPAQFVEYLWDGVKQVQLFADQSLSQWVHSDAFTRKRSSEYLVHRENPQSIISITPQDDQTYYGSCGIQHWISEKLVYEGLDVTRYLGNLIRGMDVRLGNKMAGFINTDSLRVLVDSFGIGNTNNLLLPQEDVSVELIRSPSISEHFYSGVIVEFRGGQVGWRVVGYDSVDPHFNIIPSNIRGTRNTVVIGNQRVTEYAQGLNQTQRVPYGTIMRTRQEVYDFLISYGRWLQQEGWQFDQFDETTSRMRDWSHSAREFLFWSQGPWSAGTYITLSPLALLAKFKTQFGVIQNVGQLVNGAYSVLDRKGTSIHISDLDFLRIDDEVSVKPLNDQGLYGVRIYVTSLEHALVFNNETIFGDIIYDPLLSQRQSRVRLLGYRSMNWQGRLDAPGYMVTQSVKLVGDKAVVDNKIIPNFEKSVSDLRLMFEVDPSSVYNSSEDPKQLVTSSITQSVEPKLNTMATHLVGYQERDYLTELLVDRTVAFQFYQGMIQQKGTTGSILKLLRNTNVLDLDQQLQIFEEFAFRSAMFGSTAQVHQLDFRLVQTQVVSDPQQVEFTGLLTHDDPRDQKIVILPRDARKINQTVELPPFKLRDHYGSAPSDLPTAGYVLLDEVNHIVTNTDELQALYSQLLFTDKPLTVNQRVWVAIDTRRGWDVFKVFKPSWKISLTEPNPDVFDQTTVTTSAPHGLNVGDLVIIFGVVNAGASINDTFFVNNVTTNTFDINIRTTNLGNGGTIWVYRTLRFSSVAERDSVNNRGLVGFRELVYVDGTTTQPYVVYRRGYTSWFAYRTEQLKVDTEYLLESRLYDVPTLNTRGILTLWDPVKNKIPGIFSREITYKTPYDPAQYTQDPQDIYGTNPGDAWGDDQVGVVWWDLNTTRFLDYEIGSDNYRRRNWGSIAPGTRIDIYEWVRSPVPPASWAGIVSSGTNLQAIGSNNPASGEVKNIDIPYVTRSKLNSLGQVQTIYYFWVRNANTVPDVPNRVLSTSVLAQLISAPENSNTRWWAAMNPTNILVGNVGSLLDGDNTVMQFRYTQSLELSNSHKQYDLLRPGDPQSSPTEAIWHKLQDSLVEFNAVGDSVPDLRLSEYQKFGIEIRPSQTMFENTNAARRAFVETINQFVESASSAVASDPSRQGWQALFNSVEAEPEANNILSPVQLATRTPVMVIHTGDSGASVELRVITNASVSTVAVNWVVQGVGCDWAVSIDSISIQGGDTVFTLREVCDLEQGAEYRIQEFAAFYRPHTNDQGADLVVQHFSSDPVIPGIWDEFLIDGTVQQLYSRVLVKDLPRSEHNGIYQLVSYESLGTRLSSGLVGYHVFSRTDDLRSDQDNWRLAQTQVLGGSTLSSTQWYQTNENILEVGVSAIQWQQGIAPAEWTRRVDSIASRNALDYTLNFNSQVLVAANPETQNRWTLWKWVQIRPSVGAWELVRIQGYITPEAWSYTDWYAAGYDEFTIVTQVFPTLFDRDQYVDVQQGEVVKVNNTGAGLWALYVREGKTWNTVGIENGNVTLSDRLWDYPKYQMGFDGGGFDAEGQGYEYDSRLELNQIYQALWHPQTATGFLIQDSDQNQPNQLLFVMVNHALVEQTFVDYLFKTSFINLRGFKDELQATAFYTSNKIQSLISYVNEVKPYHVKIREFVDTRNSTTVYLSNSTDFDKPPYVDPAVGPRILNPDNVADQVILSQKPWNSWLLNYKTNPDLIRKLRVRLLFDRVACAPLVYYAPGYSELTQWDTTVGDLTQLYAITAQQNITQGYLVKVLADVPDAWAIYERTAEPYVAEAVALCWIRVAYQHAQGAVDRIHGHYQPTPDQIPLDSEYLISGCAGDVTTLDGNVFSIQDSWDQTVWDNIRGWSYSERAGDPLDQSITGGSEPRYITLSANGTDLEYSLPWAPQDPNNLRIWVSGTIQSVQTDWIIQNHISTALVVNPGLGYSVNDIIQIPGGTYQIQAELKVTGVNLVGGITQVVVQNPGHYSMVPDQPVAITGGSGVGATLNCRWAGKTIQFTQAPPKATKGDNIWAVESGSTFNPTVSSVLDVIMDGAGLNAPWHQPGHPEELSLVRLRDSLIMDVYTTASAGWGAVLTRTYESDGITDQFDIGQSVWAASQLWVYVNGRLQTMGPFADYVVNMEYMRVVFMLPPTSGVVSVISVGAGGATRSVGLNQILAPGGDYQLFDYVQMQGGISSLSDAIVQITAVKAVDVIIIQGGSGYQIGDVLFYRYGESTQTLTVRVDNITSTGGTRGIITQVSILTPGYYTTLGGGAQDWFTSSAGVGAEILISWGVAQVFVVDRGIYYKEPEILTQQLVIPIGTSTGSGSGLVLRALPGAVREQITLVGDDVTSQILLSEPAFAETILVTRHGYRTYDYSLNGQDSRIVQLNFTPQLDEVVIVVVFRSSLFSLNNNQQFVVQTGVLEYTLQNPPNYSPVVTRNTQVFRNKYKLTPPDFYETLGDGTTTVFTMPFTPTASTDVTVWVDVQLLSDSLYVVAGNQIIFSAAPMLNSKVVVQYADPVVQNYDYLVVNDRLFLSSWAVTDGDDIDVITFTEDSHTSFSSDKFAGTSMGVYTLSKTPAHFGSVQVFVNQQLQNQNWDYQITQSGAQTQIQFGSVIIHDPSDVVEAYYTTASPAQPAVAMRQFTNIYDQMETIRLSDRNSTRLLEPVLVDSTTIWVAQGTALPDATVTQPGAVWIGNERIEYGGKQSAATEQFPDAVRLVQLRRGTLGTPSGHSNRYNQVNYNGDGDTQLFEVPWTMGVNPLVVSVDSVDQKQGVITDPDADFEIVVDPPSRVPGTYVRFLPERLINNVVVPSSVPESGNFNVLIIQKTDDSNTGLISWDTNALVRDATTQQRLPGGYRWPSGDQGIQYGSEPQTAFLLKEPGTRRV